MNQILLSGWFLLEELLFWRTAVTEAIQLHKGKKFANSNLKVGEDNGINKDSDYYGKVFDQMLNLWQTNDDVKKIMLDDNIGKMTSELADWGGARIWHEQALIKRPWANPASWHLGTPFWSFSDRHFFFFP